MCNWTSLAGVRRERRFSSCSWTHELYGVFRRVVYYPAVIVGASYIISVADAAGVGPGLDRQRRAAKDAQMA